MVSGVAATRLQKLHVMKLPNCMFHVIEIDFFPQSSSPGPI